MAVSRKFVAIRVTEKRKEKLKRLAESQELTITDLIQRFIDSQPDPEDMTKGAA